MWRKTAVLRKMKTLEDLRNLRLPLRELSSMINDTKEKGRLPMIDYFEPKYKNLYRELCN